MKKILLFFSFFICLSVSAVAQITGNVKNGDGNVIPFANVVLLQNDSIILSGTITDVNGNFEVQDMQHADIIKISSIGYADFYKKLSPYETVVDAVLEDSDVALDEIEVLDYRQLTKIKNGAMVTTVANTLLSKVGTAEDVLKKMPGVMAKNGIIEVFGRGAPEIYVNRRKILDESELMHLNSENIKDVQVIRNPGAKYSAETNSVIIITTLDNIGEGWSFDVMNKNILGDYYSTENQLNLNYRKKNLDIFTNLSWNRSKNNNGAEYRQTTFADTVWNFNSGDLCSYERKMDIEAKVGFNYQINASHSFGAYYQYDSDESKYHMNAFTDVFANDVPYDACRINTLSHDKAYPKNSANFYYSGQAGDLGIDLNFDYMSSRKISSTSGHENGETFDYRSITSQLDSKRRLVAEKLVFSYPILGGNFDFGNEFTNSYSKETYKNDEGYIEDSDIKVHENNNAFFAEYSVEVNDNVSMAAGIRYEHIGFDYYVFGELSASKTYDEFFPSFSTSASIGDVVLLFSYSGKTERPSYKQLSSNVEYSDRYSYTKGNPMLKPSKSNGFEFQATYKIAYVSATYSVAKDPVIYTTNIYSGDSKVRLITYENFDRIKSYIVYIGCQPSAWIWSSSVNFGIWGQKFKTYYRSEIKKMNRPIAMFQFYNNFTLPKNTVVSLDFDIMGKGNCENMEYKPTYDVDFSVQKSFFDDALDVKLAVEDLLNQTGDNLNFYNKDIFLHQVDLMETRFVSLTLKYRFNTAKSKYKGTGAGNEEKERM